MAYETCRQRCSKKRLASRARIADPNADISSWDKVRAGSIDIWVPAQKLFHSDRVLIMCDNVPASISILHSVVKIAYSMRSASVLRWDIASILLTSRHGLHRIRFDGACSGQGREC